MSKELKLIGMNVNPELYVGFTLEMYIEAYQYAANYRAMSDEDKKEALEKDWAEIEKHLPKKEKKVKKDEGESL